ncbi:Type II restriction enzyme methylase subunit [Methanonatronarchaeum thermophilum]|uniref:site-specific DNA-methyltransferase (adenine-specific) n=1 Tax=Methanonatronarchaeum thermophilum TaxID=1927129 RepID=A0A1Y3GG07_9EURY|nr:hypothetical protein [Methanonatronarchaeum thermophilum]OUJ18306.1 Type II restriction enzyme methylase subunit [Methanonatronarchaeum thermophilum]
MQAQLSYRVNSDLFSNHYLKKLLPETDQWQEVTEQEIEEKLNEIEKLYRREKDRLESYNEGQLEYNFIRPILDILDIEFEVQQTVERGRRRPDYGFFKNEEDRQKAHDVARGFESGTGDFYSNAIAVADAKRWGRKLDKRGEHKRDFENPSHQIHVYLQETEPDWAVLTNGKKWRIYHSKTSHRLDSYYEINLQTLLENKHQYENIKKEFKYFYHFFRKQAFTKDSTDKCFLDRVLEQSNRFSKELGKDLQDNIYNAIKLLAEGFLQHDPNNLDESKLDLIHDSSLTYLYRLIFVFYAESEGRDLLDTKNEIYDQNYSLNSLKQEIKEELKKSTPRYRAWQTNLWDRLNELFQLIDKGSKNMGIPEEDLYIPPYNGGLFKTTEEEATGKPTNSYRKTKLETST